MQDRAAEGFDHTKRYLRFRRMQPREDHACRGFVPVRFASENEPEPRRRDGSPARQKLSMTCQDMQRTGVQMPLPAGRTGKPAWELLHALPYPHRTPQPCCPYTGAGHRVGSRKAVQQTRQRPAQTTETPVEARRPQATGWREVFSTPAIGPFPLRLRKSADQPCIRSPCSSPAWAHPCHHSRSARAV